MEQKTDQSRRATFIRQVETLKRKAYELSNLCDIEVVLLCSDGGLFNHANRNHRSTVSHIWPEDQSRVSRILRRYKDWKNGGGKGRKSMSRKKENHKPHERKNWSHSVEYQNMLLGMVDSKFAAINTKKEELSRCSSSGPFTEAFFDELPPLLETVSDYRLSSHYNMDDANGMGASDMTRSCTVALNSVNLSKNRYRVSYHVFINHLVSFP